MRRLAAVTLLLWAFTNSTPVLAQAPVHLSPIRHIRKGVDAWPLILNPKNDAQRRINKYLRGLNAQLSHQLKECHSNYKEMMSSEPPPASDDAEGVEFWKQNTKVTMSGPAFLSIVSTADFYCGGAHPYGYTSVAVFDLSTGESADPRQWFVPSLNVSLVEVDEPDPAVLRSISSAALLDFYREATHHECDDTYTNDQPLLIWPDAKSGKVMLKSDRLPGCCEACGIEIAVKLDPARKLGFSETFLRPLWDAHKILARK